MEYRQDDVVIICNPRPVNKQLIGKRVKVYDPQAAGGTSVAASFIDKEDIRRYGGKLFYFYKDEIKLV